jgi:hypothetical protein
MNFKSVSGQTRMIEDIGDNLSGLQAILKNQFGFPCKIIFMGHEVNNRDSFENLKTSGPKENSVIVVEMKQCPVCTLYNKKTNTTCDICDTALTAAADGKKSSPRKNRKRNL